MASASAPLSSFKYYYDQAKLLDEQHYGELVKREATVSDETQAVQDDSQIMSLYLKAIQQFDIKVDKSYQELFLESIGEVFSLDRDAKNGEGLFIAPSLTLTLDCAYDHFKKAEACFNQLEEPSKSAVETMENIYHDAMFQRPLSFHPTVSPEYLQQNIHLYESFNGFLQRWAKHNDNFLMSCEKVLTSLGIAFLIKKQYSEALGYYQQANQAAISLCLESFDAYMGVQSLNFENLILITHGLAACYRHLHQLHEAKGCYINLIDFILKQCEVNISAHDFFFLGNQLNQIYTDLAMLGWGEQKKIYDFAKDVVFIQGITEENQVNDIMLFNHRERFFMLCDYAIDNVTKDAHFARHFLQLMKIMDRFYQAIKHEKFLSSLEALKKIPGLANRVRYVKNYTALFERFLSPIYTNFKEKLVQLFDLISSLQTLLDLHPSVTTALTLKTKILEFKNEVLEIQVAALAEKNQRQEQALQETQGEMSEFKVENAKLKSELDQTKQLLKQLQEEMIQVKQDLNQKRKSEELAPEEPLPKRKASPGRLF